MKLGKPTWSILLGSVLGVALAFAIVALLSGARARDAEPPAPALLAEAEGSLSEVTLHYVPRLAPVVWETYTDFLSQLASDVRVRFVVPEDITPAQVERFRAKLRAIEPSLWRRTTLVRTKGPITTWSKDRALVTQPGSDGVAWLVSPAEPSGNWVERHNDWLTVASLADRSEGKYLRKIAPFDFDSGDFAVLDSTVVVDANLIEKNAHRGIRDVATLKRRLRVWFDAEVLVLGQQPGDTPPHHLSMYMTPLDGKNVLVGDPAAARAVVGDRFCPGPRSAETGRPLCADFSAETQRQFDTAARELAGHGYHVVRIPNVPLEPKTYIAYTNGVYETRAGQRIAYLPVYDVPDLDRAARAVYEKLGWQVKPVRVRRAYAYHGTIGCLVNVLGRSGSLQL